MQIKKLNMLLYGSLSISIHKTCAPTIWKLVAWVHGPMIKRMLMRMDLIHFKEMGIWVTFIMDQQLHPLPM